MSVSAPGPLAVGPRDRNDTPIHGSCTTRVLILIDVAELAAEKSANGALGTAGFIDGLSLSVLRVLTQLCLSCPKDSWVEWAPRFFDSRHGGVGKTPAELKARLRARQAAQGTRGFARVTHASFQAFGDACLAMACGTQGDPLRRDRESALRRWAHGRNNHPPTRAQPHRGEAASPPLGSAARPSVAAGLEESREDEARRLMNMYDGHDMSSHEVVVRSLLEVLQEFAEAGEGDRTAAAPSTTRGASGQGSQKLQLLLLHSAFPHADEDAELFALRGNFTPEAAAIAVKSREGKATGLSGLLDAHLGKAILRARSRGVSLLWLDGVASGFSGSLCREEGPGSTRGGDGAYLHRCLAAAGGSSVLHWRRVVESTCLIPPSAALGRRLVGRGDRCELAGVGREGLGGVSQQGGGVALPVALNRRGAVDVHLRASTLSGSARREEGPDASALESSALEDPGAAETVARVTPWRLMGTVPVEEVWPSCLVGQSWGAATALRAEDGLDLGLGAQVWREFLGGLVEREMAAVMTLPRRLFESSPDLSCGDERQEGDISQALTVALLVPVSRGCAVSFSVRGRGAELDGDKESAGETAQLQPPAEAAARGQASVEVSSSFEQNQPQGGECLAASAAAGACDGLVRSELMLQRRGAEVGLAMQESTIARRRRRRQGKAVPGQGVRGMPGAGSSIAGTAERGAASGGQSGSLSPRDSGSLSFTGEGISGDRAAYNARQWRLEMASDVSNGSGGSLRGYRLFDAPAVGTDGGAEDDDRTSSTGSSSGPRRTLQQALEDVSSRSSLPGPDADSSSPMGDTAGAMSNRLLDAAAVGGGSRRHGGLTFPTTTDDTGEAAGFPEAIDSGPGQLPLSFMPEPALACLPGAPLPAELVALAESCARGNQAAAAASDIAAAARRPCYRPRLSTEPSMRAPGRSASPPRARARRRFIDAVRSLERGVSVASPDSVPGAARSTLARDRAAPAAGARVEAEVSGDNQPASGLTQRGTEACPAGGDGAGKSDGALGFGDRVSEGVAGLLRQYHEVVASGQRSPVDFVVRAVPQAMRDMADTDDDKDPVAVAEAADDRHARAAQVLAAVVSGLTSTPKELSAKHRSNRGAGPAKAGVEVVTTAAASPAIQKIRDYQLQALLLCQLHALAMELPEAPASLAAFSALATSGTETLDGDVRKISKNKKGKGKRRARKGKGADESSAPVRPSDPLPDYRRTRLVDYLQPISTMLDACTVTTAPAPTTNEDGDVNGGARSGGGTSAFQSRAYDGTLTDFLGLALVENFASRLPRTLAALFEDFECHPPNTLAAALAKTPAIDGGMAEDTAGAVGKGVGSEPSKGSSAEMEGAARTAEDPSKAGSGAGNDPAASANPRSSSTAGILLSDRTAMSHNHFKMSGVLNGFREVKIKAHVKSGGLRPSVFGAGSGNDQGGLAANGNTDLGEKGGWRTSNEGQGGRSARSRATRDSKQTAGAAKAQPPPATKDSPAARPRQSPRLLRKRGSVAGDEDGAAYTVRMAGEAGSKRPPPPPPPDLSAAVAPAPKRRQVAVPNGGIRKPRAAASVFVGETPQKGSGAGGGGSGGAAQKSRRRGRSARTAQDDDDPDAKPAPPAGRLAATTKGSQLLAEGGHVPGSPAMSMVGSPTTGRSGRRRAAMGPVSPENLFVAESPGGSFGSRHGRRTWVTGDLAGVGGGIGRHLMTEGASPVGPRRATVPDTPA